MFRLHGQLEQDSSENYNSALMLPSLAMLELLKEREENNTKGEQKEKSTTDNPDIFLQELNSIDINRILLSTNYPESTINFQLDKEVNEFILFHSLRVPFQKTRDLIKKHFYFVDKVKIEISVDPETPEEEQILFRLFFFSAHTQTIFEKWLSFLPEFTKTIPYEKRRFLSIELKPQ